MPWLSPGHTDDRWPVPRVLVPEETRCRPEARPVSGGPFRHRRLRSLRSLAVDMASGPDRIGSSCARACDRLPRDPPGRGRADRPAHRRRLCSRRLVLVASPTTPATCCSISGAVSGMPRWLLISPEAAPGWTCAEARAGYERLLIGRDAPVQAMLHVCPLSLVDQTRP